MIEFTFHTIEEHSLGWKKIEDSLTRLDYPLKRIRQTPSLIFAFIQLDYISDRKNKLISIFIDKKENTAFIVLKMSYSKGLEIFYSKYHHMLSWDKKEIKEFCVKMLNHDTGGFSYTRNNPYEAIAYAVADLHRMKVSKYNISSNDSITAVEIEYLIEE